MPRRVQDCGALNPQIADIVSSAIDRREFVDVVTDPNPDFEFSVAHGLGRVPVGYIPIVQDKVGTLYLGDGPWTTEEIFLKCSVASLSVRILVL